MNIVALLKKHVASNFGIDTQTIDIVWDFVDNNYENLLTISSVEEKICPNIGLPFMGEDDTQKIKTIIIFAASVKEVELTGTIEDIKDLQEVIKKQANRFHAQENTIMQAFDSFKKEVIEMFTQQNTVNSPKISNSSFHSPYRITIIQNKNKKGGTLVIHVAKNNNYIHLTDIQLQLLKALAKKCMEDKQLPSAQQGWLTYKEIKEKIDVWNVNITTDDRIRNQISLLRKKIKKLHLSELLIENSDKVGYRLGTFPENITLD